MKKIFVFLMLLATALSVNAQCIIPQPNEFVKEIGYFTIEPGSTIGYTDASLKPAADYLAGILRPSTGYALKIQKKPATITIKIEKGVKSGSYTLDVKDQGVVISGVDYQGVIAGIQSLRQLLPVEVESRSVAKGVDWTIPCCTIKDSPRFYYRGLELDVSRHFYSVSEVKSMLDVMSLYKLNKFHWHLTDDQGWRIEIKRYPKLTQKGAWRKYNGQDRGCIAKAKRSDDKDMLIPAEKHSVINGDTLYGGFYTQKEIREIVEYARVRGIDIIPEIDMPGHMLAAVENYNGVSCFSETGWGSIFSSPVCPGKDSALEFCKNVWDEVVALFPYEYVHIGGDEVEKNNWKKCDDCQTRMREYSLKTEEQLQAWFIHQMEDYLLAKGKKMIGWNEIIEGGLSNTSTIMWWGSWVKDVPEVTTAHGNDLIFTPNTEFYLDYEEFPQSMKNIYNFDVTAGLPQERQHHLLGVQGNIWCENIPSMNRMWYMTSNRMLAISELGWAAPEPHNFYEFDDRALAQNARLNKLGVTYKLRPLTGFNELNSFVGEGHYHIACKDPDVVVRYTTDGSFPTDASPIIDGETVLKNDADIIFRSFTKDGRKGDMVKARFVKDTYSPAFSVAPSKNGLRAEWHEFPGIDVNKIVSAELNQTYQVEDVCIPEGVKGNIGLIIDGYIYIPADGVYTFILTSDDGSDLQVDGNIIVDMNREQSPTTTVGQKALAKGYHKIQVRYFDHNGGSLNLVIKDENGTILNPKELYYTK